MKLEVFEYLIAIEKFGSLNKAAQNLYVSQPNLTNVIKTFEEEIGYSVLYRNHQGVQFTDKGKQVLLIAHNITKEKEKLMNINLDHQNLSFKISIGNSDFAMSAIFELLQKQTYKDHVDITIMNCAVWEALEKTYEQSIDLAYFIIPQSMMKEINDYVKLHNLLLYQLKELTCVINFRKNHPLLDNYTNDGLWNYPFVDYINQSPYAYGEYQQYINPNKIIKVDHHSLRNMLISQTDAYSISVSNPKIKNNIVEIPIPELKMIICEVRRNSDKDTLIFNHIRQRIESNL